MTALAIKCRVAGPMVLGVVLLCCCTAGFAQPLPGYRPPPVPGYGYLPGPTPFYLYPVYSPPGQYEGKVSIGPGPEPTMGWGRRHPPMGGGLGSRVVDTNADGVISESEAMAQYNKVFVDMDSNADGIITEAEYQAASRRPAEAQPGRGRPQPQPMATGASDCFQRMDQDGNKKVQREEFRIAAKQQFWASDFNGDGTVTVWEFRARNR